VRTLRRWLLWGLILPVGVASAALLGIWLQRIELANRAARAYLDGHDFGPANLTLDRLDQFGLSARDVSLRGGSFRADKVAVVFTPSGVAHSVIDKITADGVQVDLAYADGALTMGGKPLTSGDKVGGAPTIAHLEIPDMTVRLDAPDAHLGGTLSISGALKANGTKVLPQAVVHIMDGFIENSSLRADDLKADVTVTPEMILSVGKLSMAVAGGRLSASPFRFDTAESAITSEVTVDQVDLAEIFKLIGVDGLSGTGRLDGQIPLRFDDNIVRLDDAALQASGPGVLQFKSDKLPDALAGTGAEVAAGLQALEDFNYDSLSVKIDEESNGAGTVLLALRGANPAVLSGQVFNFNIKLESNFDRLADLALQGMEATQTLLRRAAERNLPQ